MRNMFYVCFLTACGMAMLLGLQAAVRAQDNRVPAAPSVTTVKETYRLRIRNALYGAVEVSVDGGVHYLLLGRVLHPATQPATDRTATEVGTVLRGGGVGLAFGVAPGQCVKLRPYAPVAPTGTGPKKGTPAVHPSTSETSAIVTNLEPEKGIFADLLPPAGSRVLLAIGMDPPKRFPDDYTISAADTFLIKVELPPPSNVHATDQTEGERVTAWRHAVRAQFESLATAYSEGATARAKAERRKVVSGTLTLKPNLPPDEPDPIRAIAYAIDEDVVAARTSPPYLYDWDTREATDGEHVVEIRALNQNGSVITRVRALVVVHNAPSGNPPQ